MNAFQKLLNLPENEKRRLGVEHTPAEIAQQPAMWARTAELLRARRDEVAGFLRRAGAIGDHHATVVLTGAGTSEFIGTAIAPALRLSLQREVISIPTTHLVTHCRETLLPDGHYLVVSFARSGNSPESLATYQRVKRTAPSARQLVITCNRDGALAVAARQDPNALCLELPEETNDRSLVMTSSFSSMAMAGTGLGLLNTPDQITALAAQAGEGANRMIANSGDALQAAAALPFNRACFLGSGALFGTMQECHLKMQEMTAGRVVCRFDSFLGLRHGPQVFVNQECIVLAALATNPSVRRYEMDLLRELARKKQGCGMVVICDRVTDELRKMAFHVIELFPNGQPAIADEHRVMTDVVAGQILGVFKSISVGLKPDTPSPDGTINRVVQGVTIYDP